MMVSPHQEHDYSSSSPMQVSERCEATLELGKRLTKELGIDESVDTLGRWMAHYIAELVQDVEKADAEKRPVKMQTCCDVILTLWKHRYAFPDGRRPFQELEPLLRAIESLDPERETPRYFQLARAAAGGAEQNERAKPWLDLIEDLDHSARILIRYCLTQAARGALDKSAEWVSLAHAAGAEESIEEILIHVTRNEHEMLEDPKCDRITKGRVERLERFAKAAMELAADLRRRIQQHNGTT